MNLSDYRTSVEVYIAELQAKLRASEAECERLRRELWGVRVLLRELAEMAPKLSTARIAAVEYLKAKEGKLPPQPQPSERVEDAADGQDDEGSS